jgi:hypothetical protein
LSLFWGILNSDTDLNIVKGLNLNTLHQKLELKFSCSLMQLSPQRYAREGFAFALIDIERIRRMLDELFTSDV